MSDSSRTSRATSVSNVDGDDVMDTTEGKKYQSDSGGSSPKRPAAFVSGDEDMDGGDGGLFGSGSEDEGDK